MKILVFILVLLFGYCLAQREAEIIESLLRDFPTALDNHKTCMKVKVDGKFLDWPWANRNLCEQSNDLYNTFLDKNLTGPWCKMAKRNAIGWERDNALQCRNVASDKRQFCKNIENKLKAVKELNCDFLRTSPTTVQTLIVQSTRRTTTLIPIQGKNKLFSKYFGVRLISI